MSTEYFRTVDTNFLTNLGLILLIIKISGKSHLLLFLFQIQLKISESSNLKVYHYCIWLFICVSYISLFIYVSKTSFVILYFRQFIIRKSLVVFFSLIKIVILSISVNSSIYLFSIKCLRINLYKNYLYSKFEKYWLYIVKIKHKLFNMQSKHRLKILEEWMQTRANGNSFARKR